MIITATLIALATSASYTAGALIINVLEILRNAADIQQQLARHT